MDEILARLASHRETTIFRFAVFNVLKGEVSAQ